MSRQRPPDHGQYIVQDGEWVGSIAIRFGFADWKKDLWMHGDNAGLRNLRQDPHTLAEGDQLYIPPWQDHKESRATGSRHTFRLKVPSEVLRIRLLDADHAPIADEPYVLEVQFGPGGGTYTQQNAQTDKKGILTEAVPSTALSGKLRIPRLDLVYPLQFGYLTPLDLSNRPLLIHGTQQRLNLLGFEAGPDDGIEGPLTQAAVERFQRFCRDNHGKPDAKGNTDARINDAGPVDGIMGPRTREALLKYYGC